MSYGLPIGRQRYRKYHPSQYELHPAVRPEEQPVVKVQLVGQLVGVQLQPRSGVELLYLRVDGMSQLAEHEQLSTLARAGRRVIITVELSPLETPAVPSPLPESDEAAPASEVSQC